jgi:hypothetical protein
MQNTINGWLLARNTSPSASARCKVWIEYNEEPVLGKGWSTSSRSNNQRRMRIVPIEARAFSFGIGVLVFAGAVMLIFEAKVQFLYYRK